MKEEEKRQMENGPRDGRDKSLLFPPYSKIKVKGHQHQRLPETSSHIQQRSPSVFFLSVSHEMGENEGLCQRAEGNDDDDVICRNGGWRETMKDERGGGEVTTTVKMNTSLEGGEEETPPPTNDEYL